MGARLPDRKLDWDMYKLGYTAHAAFEMSAKVTESGEPKAGH